jgi:hypothetical protein
MDLVTELASELTLQLGVPPLALLEESPQAMRPNAAVKERANPSFFIFIIVSLYVLQERYLFITKKQQFFFKKIYPSIKYVFIHKKAPT